MTRLTLSAIGLELFAAPVATQPLVLPPKWFTIASRCANEYRYCTRWTDSLQRALCTSGYTSTDMTSGPAIQIEFVGLTTGVSHQSMMITGSGASTTFSAVDK